MRHCAACGVDYSGAIERCPLCHGELVGDPTPAVFPHTENVRTQRALLTIVTLASAIGVLTCAFLGLLGVLRWGTVALVALAVGANYLLVRNFLRYEPGFVRGASRYLLALMAIVVVWRVFSGADVLTSFVAPVICLASLAFDAALLVVWRARFAAEFSAYLLLDVACGLIPLALVWLGLAQWPTLAYVSAFAAGLLAVFVLVFFRRDLFGAGERLFNA
ncbi:DUF6320 domain-containing protein [Atopobiaceae bacterium 24-176]